jgi:pheromone shutdown-related protein TraB
VFKKSIAEVRSVIEAQRPSYVCVELDMNRYHALRTGQRATFGEMQRQHGLRVALLGSLLSMIQSEIGEDFGVMPGTEMVTAVDVAKDVGAEVHFIDREVSITLTRLVSKMTFREKLKTVVGAFLSLTPLKREVPVSQFDESFVEQLLREFKRFSPHAFEVLIEERNIFMARYIVSLLSRATEPASIVVVVGAGHLVGVVSLLEAEPYDRQINT